MDKIYPKIHRPAFAAFYAGFEEIELVHYYPGKIFSDAEYTPIIQE